MPTSAEFHRAAAKLDFVADQVGALMVATERADPASVLSGGSLGVQIPELIAESARHARLCHSLVEEAAQTCRERAEFAMLYQQELDAFAAAIEVYEGELYWYQYDMSDFLSGIIEFEPFPPGPPPDPPPAPPAWFEPELGRR